MSDPPATPQPAPPDGRVALSLKPGHAILEYAVEQTLGGGGFGITYRARDANLNLAVALKEYLPADLATRDAGGKVQPLGDVFEAQFRLGLENFLEEARALATFRHPNIVRVLRYFPANGTAYIVMEYESGISLKHWRPRQPALDRTSLLGLVLPLLDGLEVVHQAGFLHRDIKPDNIYMRADGSPVLIDFGSARRTVVGRDLTSIISPGFAPFEQYHSRGNQGPWTDLYSLAAVMYWLVSGAKPMESASRLKKDTMVPAAQSAPHHVFGAALLQAIDWALDPEETARPQSVAEFRDRLREAAGLAVAAPMAQQTRAMADWPATARVGDAAGASLFASGGATIEAQRRNMVCTILFLDIVAYSKTSVNEQYDLKSIFNQMIASKLAHVPAESRITLDTGDGAAICFMGDPEDVLHAAVDIRSTLGSQNRLNVRMGLHIGPVRVLNDLNGRGNVVGDGINVAQRVMNFAEPNALVASRAFYEVVACLSDNGEQAFRYLGEHRDKHDRAHEIYAVVTGDEAAGFGDRTISLQQTLPGAHDDVDAFVVGALERELAQHLGPLASVLIRKVRARATDVADMRRLLAQSIADPAQREAFARGPGVAESADKSAFPSPDRSRLGPATSAHGMAGSGPPGGHSMPSTKDSRSTPTDSATPWLPVEMAVLLEKLLAQAIGPLARVLVKTEMRKTSNLPDLCQTLAGHIDKPEARATFLSDAKNKLRR